MLRCEMIATLDKVGVKELQAFDVGGGAAQTKGKRIIAFSIGIVNSDPEFEIIKRKDLLLPKGHENWKKDMRRDLFRDKYGYIKDVLENQDVTNLAWGVSSDFKFLNDTTDFFNLSPIDMKSIDVQRIYRHLTQRKASEFGISLAGAAEAFDLRELHNAKKSSIRDSELTLRIFEEICKHHGASSQEILNSPAAHPYHSLDFEKSSRFW